jgi:hypothetical protein
MTTFLHATERKSETLHVTEVVVVVEDLHGREGNV